VLCVYDTCHMYLFIFTSLLCVINICINFKDVKSLIIRVNRSVTPRPPFFLILLVHLLVVFHCFRFLLRPLLDLFLVPSLFRLFTCNNAINDHRIPSLTSSIKFVPIGHRSEVSRYNILSTNRGI
jgi:hypothetical protein